MFKLIPALVLSAIVLLVPSSVAKSRKSKKTRFPVFGEFGLGIGQNLFFGSMKSTLVKTYGGAFDPGTGNNVVMGFYVVPDYWKGFGIGPRLKGTFGTSVRGYNGDTYIFNAYNLAITNKFYPISKEFNDGLYFRQSLGCGQFTTKRINEEKNVFKNQTGTGISIMSGVGYTFEFKNILLSIEAEFEYSNRIGTIDGKGDAGYQSGQIGGNIILSF